MASDAKMGDSTGSAWYCAQSRTHLDGCVIFGMEEVMHRSFLFPATLALPLSSVGLGQDRSRPSYGKKS